MSVSNPRRPWICFIRVQKPLKWISFRECVCVCVFFFACACAPTSLFSLSAAVQCLPLRGRLCLRWPTLHECKCWSPPFPPSSLAKQEQLLLGKRKKKVPGVSSAMELLCPPRVVQWGAEISGGESLVSVSCCVLYILFADFLGLNVSVCILGRLPRLGPFVCGIVQCYLGRTQRAKHSKECVQSF